MNNKIFIVGDYISICEMVENWKKKYEPIRDISVRARLEKWRIVRFLGKATFSDENY